MTKTTATKKFTLNDLKPRTKRVFVDHPVHGVVDAWFDVLPPQSLEYMEAFLKRQQQDISEMTLQEKLTITAALPASVVTGWNEELFGQFSKEAVMTLLTDFANQWLLFGLNNKLDDTNSFYTD